MTLKLPLKTKINYVNLGRYHSLFYDNHNLVNVVKLNGNNNDETTYIENVLFKMSQRWRVLKRYFFFCVVRSCADIIHLDEVVPQKIKLLNKSFSIPFCFSICIKVPPICVPWGSLIMPNQVYSCVDIMCAENKKDDMKKGLT